MTKRIIIFGKFLAMMALTSHLYSMEITNKNVPLLPNEIICCILAHSIDMTQSLKTIIISCLQLSTISKHINIRQLFITIGTACSRYGATDKNTLMEKLLRFIFFDEEKYNNRRNGAFLLTYAGADNNPAGHFSLLRHAISFNDNELIAALFKNNVNPNQISSFGDTDFFYIKTIDIAQMFIDNNVDLTIQNNTFSETIIWNCIDRNYCPNLIEFYLNHNALVNTLITDGACILHFLARGHYCQNRTPQDNITVATLILKKAPDMINALCKEYECELTPLDISQAIIKKCSRSKERHKILTELITLFKSYGGKTAEELKQDLHLKKPRELKNLLGAGAL